MIDHAPGLTHVVLDSPHSGTDYPEDFRAACPLPALRQAEDTHVDDLWSFASGLGHAWVAARFPRTYVDVNRNPDDIDLQLLDAPWPTAVDPAGKSRLGKGLVWRLLDDGTPVYARRLAVHEVQERLARCWAPYHAALDAAVDSAYRRHGQVLHLNCHSMPAVADRWSTDFPGLVHADFVLGDRDGTTAHPALTRWISRFLQDRGYSVSVNHPYKGVEIVRRHGRPLLHRHSIQVEINKRLYMNEQNLELTPGHERLRRVLKDLLAAVARVDLQRLSQPAVDLDPGPLSANLGASLPSV
ncbi:MAG: N-formylglutamate amidohydrolase [Rubrivivax sp.]|jgi:N-formylglutamate deformylase